jgi:cation diffusion facilitator CzcD-associated flavoprotein CzcO
VAKIAAKNAEQPEVIFTLEMREKMHGVWRRRRAGTWVSTTTWTIDLTQEEYETLHRYIAALRKPGKMAARA